jgi:CheY-like chemotaxis protein
MSHEIRTPLTAILGCADSLFRQLDDPDPKDVVRMIRDQGHLLLGILNDVLDLSKIEAGKLEINIEACDPVRILGDVHSLMHSQAIEKGIELRTTYLTRIPERIRTDPLRLRQILLNIVSNAIKFTEKGCIEMQASCLVNQGEVTLQIAVEDTGIGIPADRLKSIFEAFTQGKSLSKSRSPGTGLGLTICDKLVQMLGGVIKVTSQVGKGSRFVVELPAGELDASLMKDPEEVTRTAALRDSHMTLDTFIPCRVLIAEDTRAIQFMMSRMLADVVTSLTVVENGELVLSAVETAARAGKPFDIILMDMQMPIMNGFDATRKLRDRGYTLPVIALTAGAMAGDREECLAAGCTDYLPKPIDRMELLAKLEQHCDA